MEEFEVEEEREGGDCYAFLIFFFVKIDDEGWGDVRREDVCITAFSLQACVMSSCLLFGLTQRATSSQATTALSVLYALTSSFRLCRLVRSA